jgi:hypothetical protein
MKPYRSKDKKSFRQRATKGLRGKKWALAIDSSQNKK